MTEKTILAPATNPEELGSVFNPRKESAMTEIVAAHLERFIKIARQVAHDYDVWCEHIDDPDIEKLEEMLAAALAACAREERLTAIQDAIQAFEGEYCNHEQPLVGVVRGVKAMCALKFEAERAVGEKASLDPPRGQHDS